MGSTRITMDLSEKTGDNLFRSNSFPVMLGDYLKCTVMFGNGARITGKRNFSFKNRKLIQPGQTKENFE
jgi:hypothetical protein